MAWTNSDGLRVAFGSEEATVSTAGAYNKKDMEHEVEAVLTLTAITASAALVGSNTLVIPKGARITRLKIIAETAATSGGSATLNFGLQRLDRSTELDYDGFIAALAKTAYDAAGETTDITVGSTGAGALIGTTLANPGYLTADYDTAAFTAGVLRIKLFFYFP